jgi:hypothetical protein
MRRVKPRTCIHCETKFKGKYCPECGQRVGILPSSPGFFFNSLLRALDLERGMPITFLHLFTRPAAVTDQFLRGNTRRYTNPFQYLLVSLTITFLFFFHRENWLLYGRSALLIAILFISNYVFSRRYTTFYGHLMIAMYQAGQISFLFLLSALVGPYLNNLSGSTEWVIGFKYVIFLSYLLWSSVSMFHLTGQRVYLFLLLIFVNVNLGIFLWLQFVVQQKPLASLLGGVIHG